MRTLTASDVEALAIGTAILGTGGGGNPYITKLQVLEQLKHGRRIRLLGLDELPDEALVLSIGGIGAPAVSIEKLEEGTEGERVLRCLEEFLDVKIDAVISAEIGGGNGLVPLITAAALDLPVVDADGMGRAFPEMQMTTFSIYGHRSTPAVVCDEHGNLVLFRLGHLVLEANRAHASAIPRICAEEHGIHLINAKIVDLKRHLRAGFSVGALLLEGIDQYAGTVARIDFQNEFLTFERAGRVEACVPDLIVILDVDTGHAITTDVLRYGQRIAVLALPCHPLLRTAEALAVVGPAAFGLNDVSYNPLPRPGESAP